MIVYTVGSTVLTRTGRTVGIIEKFDEVLKFFDEVLLTGCPSIRHHVETIEGGLIYGARPGANYLVQAASVYFGWPPSILFNFMLTKRILTQG